MFNLNRKNSNKNTKKSKSSKETEEENKEAEFIYKEDAKIKETEQKDKNLFSPSHVHGWLDNRRSFLSNAEKWSSKIQMINY